MVRLFIVLLALPAAAGAVLVVAWLLWHMGNAGLAPVAEGMQASGALDPRPFVKGLIQGGSFSLLFLGALARKSSRKLPAGLLFSSLGALVALSAIAILGAQLPVGVASLVGGLGLCCLLFLVLMLVAGAVVIVVRFIRSAWQSASHGTWPLVALSLAGTFAVKELKSEAAAVAGPVRNADDPVEVARLLLADAAYERVAVGQPEQAIVGMPARPGVHYSASGPIRAKKRGESDKPLWRCYRTLTEEPDPGGWLGGTPQDDCVRRMRRAGLLDPENEAMEVVLRACRQAPTEPVAYYSKSCTYAIESSRRRAAVADRWRDAQQTEAVDDSTESRLDSARCLQAARARLTPREYEVLSLDAQGFDHREIAHRIGESYGNARQIASRARSKFKEACPDLR